MELHDIYYVPMSGGTNNSGRKRTLSYGVWRHSDNRFLNASTGQWLEKPCANNLLEQGRGQPHARFGDSEHMKGAYLPERPTTLGTEPLAGHYTVLFYDREQDKLIIDKEEIYVDQLLTTTPAPARKLNMFAVIAGLALFTVLFTPVRR